jgi:hypothetical protein
MTEGDKFRLKKAGYHFMDVTDHPDLGQRDSQRARVSAKLPSVGVSDQAQSSIKAMMIALDDKHLRADIAILSSFWNRCFRSVWGLLSSDWIHDHVKAVRPESDQDFNWLVELYDTDTEYCRPRKDSHFGDQISPFISSEFDHR